MQFDVCKWLGCRLGDAVEAGDFARAEKVLEAAFSDGGWRGALERQLSGKQ